MTTNNAPDSGRVRTDDGNKWRFDAIERAAEFYDCNWSDAVAFTCEGIPELVNSLGTAQESCG
jgi:hypothetical protein